MSSSPDTSTNTTEETSTSPVKKPRVMRAIRTGTRRGGRKSKASKLVAKSRVFTKEDGTIRTGRGRPSNTDTVSYTATNPEDQMTIMRELCRTSFYDYIRITAPYAVMGQVHKDFCEFLQYNPEKSSYQLGLLPRGHRKSFIIGMYCCWRIIKNPAITILYFSSTTDLAEKQLRSIKQTLESKIHQKLFPDLINPIEGNRDKWSASEICVDSPIRIREGVRDSTVATAGLTTTTTGSHADLIVLDDLVEPNNNNPSGRKLVEERYSQMQSILNPGGTMVAVGTRYDPKDLYDRLLSSHEDIYDDTGAVVGKKKSWSVFQREVEKDGEFLWPRAKRADGKYFGYDLKELARIRSNYLDITQFYSQYYNDPNRIGASKYKNSFIYYDKSNLQENQGRWSIGGKKLALFAAIDFAYSLSDSADYSCIAVVGVTADKMYYIIDIDRFKTDRIHDFFEHVVQLHSKYNFRKIRGEATVAQSVIVKYLKDELANAGRPLTVEEYKPIKDKVMRMDSILRPLYEGSKIFHYKGGNCELLEAELLAAKPEHDDIKNAVADAVEICTPPFEIHTASFRKMFTKRYGEFGGTI